MTNAAAPAASKLSPAQIKTLTTIAANGGEMNTYAGQRGFYTHSIKPLARLGLVERVEGCEPCAANDDWANEVCARPLAGQGGGGRCYGRIRITTEGRAAVAAEPTVSADWDDEPRSIAHNANARTGVYLGVLRDV